jgi:hypothetical protein
MPRPIDQTSLDQLENRVSALTAEVARYRDELNVYKQAYSDLIKFVPAIAAVILAVLGWNFRTWRMQQETRVQKLCHTTEKRVATIIASNTVAERLGEERSDLIVRSLRYLVEKARSDIEEQSALQEALSDVYYGLGLFACDTTEVRAAAKALCVRSSGTTPLQWLNEIRGVWTERLHLEHDVERAKDINALLKCIDEAVDAMLARIGNIQAITLFVAP